MGKPTRHPFTTREKLSLLLPPWLVRLLGPYPDEVGLAWVAAKWLAVLVVPTWLWFDCVERLVPEHERGRWAGSLVLFGLAGLWVGLARLRGLRK